VGAAYVTEVQKFSFIFNAKLLCGSIAARRELRSIRTAQNTRLSPTSRKMHSVFRASYSQNSVAW